MSRSGKSDLLPRNLFMLFLFVGVAAVLVGLWQVKPPLPPTMLPIEGTFRSEVSFLAGVDDGECKYYSKMLMLSCRVGRVSEESIQRNLQAHGWARSPSGGSRMLFTRRRDSVEFLCDPSGPSGQTACDVKLWRTLGAPAA